MSINNLVCRLVRLTSKGLIVALIGTSASLYKPVLAEAPISQEGWNPLNIQTLLSHSLANESFKLSEQEYNTYLLYTESITAGLSYKDFKILKRIAFCESSLRHEGVFGPDKKDYGLFQIRIIHEAKAEELGLDYKSVEGNIKYAVYLYKSQNTKPWYASKHCWSKY